MKTSAVPPIDLAQLGDLTKTAERKVSSLIRSAGRVAALGIAASGARKALRMIQRASARRRTSGRRKAWFAAGMGIGVVTVAVARWQFQRLFAPGPAYNLEELRGELEVRRYPGVHTANTTVGEPWDLALKEGFTRLAHFIFGKNAAQAKIAMTAPVLAVPDDAGYRVSFVMPEGAIVPNPEDPRVVLTKIPARRMAVMRFNGHYDSASIEAKKQVLVATAMEAGYVPRGEPMFAGYDPPSTLPLFRRNEVWLEIEG